MGRAHAMIWNSAYYWGIPARILHWLAAVLLVVVYGDGLLFAEAAFDHGGDRAAAAWHAAAGLTFAVLMLGRMFWRFGNVTPMLPAGTPLWGRLAAHGAQIGLYVLAFVVVLSGWIMAAGLHQPLEPHLFWIVPVPAPTALVGAVPHKFAEVAHEWLAHGLIALAVVHALAALWHHYVRHDSVMRRMLFRGKNRQRQRTRQG